VESSVREDLAARLQALSQAHGALMERNWASADLSDLVARALAPFQLNHHERFSVDGPPLRLSPQQSVSFSLVLHELATNAVKHGALSAPDGGVLVTWNQSLNGAGDRRMTFLWVEHGGPPVRAPTRRGFGSRLLAGSFPGTPEGDLHLDFAPSGLKCTIALNLSGEEERPMFDLVAAARGI
jgi:two-component sensor histidine kinase